MTDRYGDPAVREIWSRDSQIRRWAQVEKDAAIFAGADWRLIDDLPDPPTGQQVDEAEAEHGNHEMVAFLAVWLKDVPEKTTCWVHRGLTTSDVTDTATSLQMSATVNVMLDRTGRLLNAASDLESYTPRLARTHGQPAGKTTLQHQIRVRSDAIKRMRIRLTQFAPKAMFTGPLGHTHNWPPNAVSGYTGQAMPRDLWADWVDSMVTLAGVLEDMAWLWWAGIRDGEFRLESGSTSSSMPHKVNPTRLERVAGMARLARGYRVSLGECLTMRDDRDLAHSSVERVALPGLAICVSQALSDLIEVTEMLRVNEPAMRQNADRAPDSHERLVKLMEQGSGYLQARKEVSG